MKGRSRRARAGLLAALAVALVCSLRLWVAPLRLHPGPQDVVPPTPAPAEDDSGGGAADRRRLQALLAAWPAGKPRAAILVLARNSEAAALNSSMAELEARYNSLPGRGYPWLFLNDEPFTQAFRDATSRLTAAPCFYAQIPAEHWGYPPGVSPEAAAAARADMEARNVLYGGLESYHFMIRYFSG